MSEFQFSVTYRDITVPDWVHEAAVGEEFDRDEIRAAFRQGVDAALGRQETAVGGPMRGEPDRGKRWRDGDGDIWSYNEDGWGYRGEWSTTRSDLGGWATIVAQFASEFLETWREES